MAWRENSAKILREAAAPVLWIYAVVKLAIFDIDAAIVSRIAPEFTWVITYKFFIAIGAVALTLAAFGGKNFTSIAVFVALYPLVVAWRVAKLLFKRWPVVVVFLPVVETTIRRFRSTFVLYTMAILGGLAILLSTNRIILIGGLCFLAPLLIAHLGRALGKSFRGGPFAGLIDLLRKLTDRIEQGTVMDWLPKESTATSSDPKASQGGPALARQFAYSAHLYADLASTRIKTVATRGYYDLFLFASLLYTVFLVTTLFAFAHMAVHKAFNGAYAGAAGADFWSFLGLSASLFIAADLSRITPVGNPAVLLTYAETICRYGILVIGSFLVISAARDNYRKSLDEFTNTLTGVVTAVERRISAEWQITVKQLERLVLTENAKFVNSLRKLGGLNELAVPEVEPVIEGEVVQDNAGSSGSESQSPTAEQAKRSES